MTDESKANAPAVGEFLCENVEVVINDISGYCPVQADGTFDGIPFYFRARGQRWAIGVGGDDIVLHPDWSYGEPYGEGRFDAGWMEISVAEEFIRKASKMWRAARASENMGTGMVSGR